MRALVWSSIVCGAVGVLRHRRESALVRRGRLAPLGPTTRTAPPQREGRLASVLARWVPRRPATRAGRVAAAVWAAPMTLVGIVLGLSSGARGSWRDDVGALVFEDAGRHGRLMLRLVGADANTIGQVVISRRSPVPAALLAHESGHVRQGERLGVALLPLYTVMGARYGYRHNPFERSARAAAREHVRAGAGPPSE